MQAGPNNHVKLKKIKCVSSYSLCAYLFLLQRDLFLKIKLFYLFCILNLFWYININIKNKKYIILIYLQVKKYYKKLK
jgi:hypothetical protein